MKSTDIITSARSNSGRLSLWFVADANGLGTLHSLDTALGKYSILSSQLSPEDETEHSVWSQAKEACRHALVEAHHAFSLEHLDKAVQDARVHESLPTNVSRLIIQPRAANVKGGHGCNHHNSTRRAGHQCLQPRPLAKHLQNIICQVTSTPLYQKQKKKTKKQLQIA